MKVESVVKSSVCSLINIHESELHENTLLFGQYAELDSMGVVMLLMEFEEKLNLNTSNIELSAELFESFGSLVTGVKCAIGEKVN
ncbi:hypothetical protein J8L98_02040 [Pseudoalteromonas sp. MMG013]|uniref:Carrier domain-containing protein n=1 Tax=Pseudoalteromonas aurantia 208 TaxID=1314867 RepID=A0ABR9EII7_9GAMM|nr:MULTISPECIES: hypothetical protein [Pseudoalteromonas]MBE0370547.1 hypothetical protein [Pseudoalteromonas aurantia 208]MBQ4845148.1 hypothetical protein [Pseudoalteromonas sp. MMG005]MBQ4852437.1 hypothetical protein [Pseudoalteromonas sp. MMG012]MBQ4860472.1 hypothetical protein [Pseudoalteromonas sp. MMG013]